MSTRGTKTTYEWLLNFQTRLQGVGNTLAAEITKLISQTDLLILKTVIARFPAGRTISVRAQMAALVPFRVHVRSDDGGSTSQTALIVMLVACLAALALSLVNFAVRNKYKIKKVKASGDHHRRKKEPELRIRELREGLESD